jgi:hypothetical protein
VTRSKELQRDAKEVLELTHQKRLEILNKSGITFKALATYLTRELKAEKTQFIKIKKGLIESKKKCSYLMVFVEFMRHLRKFSSPSIWLNGALGNQQGRMLTSSEETTHERQTRNLQRIYLMSLLPPLTESQGMV